MKKTARTGQPRLASPSDVFQRMCNIILERLPTVCRREGRKGIGNRETNKSYQ